MVTVAYGNNPAAQIATAAREDERTMQSTWKHAHKMMKEMNLQHKMQKEYEIFVA